MHTWEVGPIGLVVVCIALGKQVLRYVRTHESDFQMKNITMHVWYVMAPDIMSSAFLKYAATSSS